MLHTLGLDIGGVMIDVRTRITKPQWLEIQQIPDSQIPPVAPLATIRSVLHKFERVHLVSAASPEQQVRILGWFGAWKVWEELGLSPENIHFCANPSDKGALCRLLPNPPDVFIDDTPEALVCLAGIVPHRIFFDRLEEEIQPEGTRRVESWDEIGAFLRTISI